MDEICTITVTPRNQALLADILKNKFREKPLLDKLCCRFNFHNKREYEGICFCASCFLLISGSPKELWLAIEAAKFQAEKSTLLHANATEMTFAYEDHCESMKLEDVVTLQLLQLVRERLQVSESTD